MKGVSVHEALIYIYDTSMWAAKAISVIGNIRGHYSIKFMDFSFKHISGISWLGDFEQICPLISVPFRWEY